MTTSLTYLGFVESVHAIFMNPALHDKQEIQRRIEQTFKTVQGQMGKSRNKSEIIAEMIAYRDDIIERLDDIIAQRPKMILAYVK